MLKLKPLIISLLISLGTGALSSSFTMNSMGAYSELNKPLLSPPGYVFPIVWTILFTLMGISSYMIYESNSSDKNMALKIYATQLVFNFLWSIVFFNLQAPLLAFIVLLVLWVLIIAMIRSFYNINQTAAYLQIPYLLWVTFAGYLNFAIYLLNR